MRLSHFFIDRPIFVAVISVIFVVGGGVSVGRLPIAQYPDIAPPMIKVSGQYPGASADVVAATVVAPLEQQMRLRPILMTSLAFIFGVAPLVWARGAGAELRRALSTAVFAGRIGVTVFGLIFTPGFYVICRWIACVGWRRRPAVVPVSTPAE